MTLPPSQVAEIYQVDRVLYDYGITLVPPEDLQRYVNDLRETVCDTAPPDYTLSNGSLNGSCKCISLVKKRRPPRVEAKRVKILTPSFAGDGASVVGCFGLITLVK